MQIVIFLPFKISTGQTYLILMELARLVLPVLLLLVIHRLPPMPCVKIMQMHTTPQSLEVVGYGNYLLIIYIPLPPLIRLVLVCLLQLLL